jgi:hypothetical protein
MTDIDDEFARAVARRLSQRGIVKIPGLGDEKPEDTLADRLAAYGAGTLALEQRLAEQRQAEQDAATPPKTAAGILHRAIAGSSAPVPLNGMGVLLAAIAGMGTGTINGVDAEVQQGRNE